MGSAVLVTSSFSCLLLLESIDLLKFNLSVFIFLMKLLRRTLPIYMESFTLLFGFLYFVYGVFLLLLGSSLAHGE